MNVTAESSPRPAPTLPELGGVALGLLALVGVQLALADACYLFGRHFWVDELHTFAIVSDPDLSHALDALANCVDGNPPGMHLLLRGFTLLTGGPDEVSCRSFAFVSVLVAMLGLYVSLRQVFRPLVAFTTVLAVWCHPLVLTHAFETRFYGPWLAAVVWFSYFLARARGPARGPVNNALLGLSAVLVCTIHFFGIFALGLVVAFELAFHRTPAAYRWKGLAAAALGPLALGACSPFYFGQSAGLSIPTWVDARDLDGTLDFVAAVLSPRFLWAVLAAGWVFQLTRPALPERDQEDRDRGKFPALAGLTGVILLPVVLILFSLAVQPTLEDRYALPAWAALAPAIAWTIFRMTRPWLFGLCIFLVLAGAKGLRHQGDTARATDQATDELIAALREHTAGRPVLFESIHELFVVCRYAPELRGRCFLLDFRDGEIGDVDDSRVINRDLGRKYAEYYAPPGLMPWQKFKHLRRCFLVVEQSTFEERSANPETWYPGFTPRPIDSLLYELVPARANPGVGSGQENRDSRRSFSQDKKP